ncbi:tyrosine-type recombinase/integrase [Nonomuraea salmonea]|uniref:Tyrosine-type recombinase/integrase n=1 Tax=Nonomuraea salmonea TaxID=46181 RepID=A0ABV5NN75_9ACTN
MPTTSPTARTNWFWPAAFPPLRLHDLRHGAATPALAAGANLRVVQGLLGHAGIVLTADTYTAVLPQPYPRQRPGHSPAVASEMRCKSERA